MNEGIGFLKHYDFELPAELLAQAPAQPRDSSRLLLVDAKTGELKDSIFSHLADHLPAGALLIMNETKVIPARIILTKGTGGKVEVLFYVNLWNRETSRITGIVDRKIREGDVLFHHGEKICSVADQDENVFAFELSVRPPEFLAFLRTHGVMPVPKYIKNTPLDETDLRERYQTTFAKHPGSVAAPTASLHFTDDVFKKLSKKGIEVAKLTLHVGAGTFAPLTDREFSSGKLHLEKFCIPKETIRKIAQAKKEGRPVIAVGTTALRALESLESLDSKNDVVSETQIFIRKPYSFRFADGLITNFHVPRSSLMCLVDAFLDFKKSPKNILDIYKYAISRKYRFYSFGDGMIVL